MIRLEIKNCNMILIEKLQKHQPYHQANLISMNIFQVKKYCLLIKAFEKQTKTIEDQGQKQVDDKQLPSIKDFILNPEIIDEIERIEEKEKKADGSKIVYKGYNKIYDFRKFKIIRVFGNEIKNNIINISMANDE